MSLSLYCAITSHLPDDDIRKFSMRIPKTIQWGIKRIWEAEGNVKFPKIIIHDCDKALRAFGVVYRAGGKMVPWLANHNGHRNHAAGRNKAGWGGVPVKNVLVEEVGRWLHRDAEEVKLERNAELIEIIQSQADQVEVPNDEEEDSEVDN